MLKTGWWELKQSSMETVLFLIDCSDELFAVGESRWQQMVAWLRSLCASLPAPSRHQVFALGSPEGVSLPAFLKQHAAFRQAHQGRCTLLGPFGQMLQQNHAAFPNPRIVIFRVGECFDREDWIETIWLTQAIDIPLSKTPASEEEPKQWGLQANEILSKLQTSPERIRLSSDQLFPLSWTNSAYQWKGQHLMATRGRDFSIIVQGVCQAGTVPVAEIELISGETLYQEFRPCDPILQTEWQALNEQENAIVTQCLDQKQYLCPHCQAKHSANTLRCRNTDRMLGEAIFPSMDNQGPPRFLILEKRNTSWGFQTTSHQALAFDTENACQIVGRSPCYYQFQANTQSWVVQPETEFQQFQSREDNTVAIFL